MSESSMALAMLDSHLPPSRKPPSLIFESHPVYLRSGKEMPVSVQHVRRQSGMADGLGRLGFRRSTLSRETRLHRCQNQPVRFT